MYNELIDALRYCADVDKICTEQTNCGYYGKGFFCQEVLLRDAADALEAAEKRIEELEAQLPKEGEWIEANTRPRSAQFYCSVCHRTCYDIQPTRDKVWTKRCRYNYCPNCGARMRGEHDDC